MTRKQFTFYESFARALSRIKDKSDRADAYDALVNYALYGKDPDLDSMSDVAAVAFELIKPNLDSSRKKASNGKSGGSKPQANRKQTSSKLEAKSKQDVVSKEEASDKQTASKKEVEKEKEGEIEKEKEDEDECPPSPPVVNIVQASNAVADFLNRVNPSAASSTLLELAEYEKTLGTDVCKRAFDVALGEKKTNWAYIRGILRNCEARGIRSLADWEAGEQKRKRDGGGCKNPFLEIVQEMEGTDGRF